jgi:glycosyltransferase involved in cell wall biosynthesis
MNVSILIPSRNGREFLEWSYNSIRKNQGYRNVEIIVLDDISDKDDTWEWCLKTMSNDASLKAFKNETGERFGISGGYKYLSQFATQEVICHWHNDMFMTEGTLDAVEQELFEDDRVDIGYGDYWTNRKPVSENVVCLTRIEPTIYCDAGVYPEKIVWKDAPIELEQWDEQKFLNYLPIAKQLWSGLTEGHFAPFFMFTNQYLALGGNDILNFPKQAREDSDWGFRLALAEFKTIQIPQFVYHFASRGNRRSKHEAGNYIDNPEWKEIEIKSVKNFIRKWQTFLPLHDAFYKPRKPVRYNTLFRIKNCHDDLLDILEPWCDFLQCDLDNARIKLFIEHEQPNTPVDLNSKFFDVPNTGGIIVEIDGLVFGAGEYKHIQYLSQIIEQNEQLGKFELDNLKITIDDLTHYEKNLIVCA